MALDEALARSLEPGRAVLRLYAWSTPTVSFGRNEPARQVYGPIAPAGPPGGAALADVAVVASPPDLEFVRRPTGGRAVLHDAEVTYAVVAPVGALGGPREAYRRINESLAAALRSLGADVEVSAGTGAEIEPGGSGSAAPAVLPLDAGPCFRSPAPGEVIARGRKLVGSAQARIGRALLQHGSIILDGDQSRLAELSGGESGPDAPTSLRALIGTVEVAEVVDALAGSVVGALGGREASGGYTPAESELAAELETARYGTEAWTWRR